MGRGYKFKFYLHIKLRIANIGALTDGKPFSSVACCNNFCQNNFRPVLVKETAETFEFLESDSAFPFAHCDS